MEFDMAIIIPSKNIYGDIENPKVRNNFIDKVEIKQKIIAPENKYDEIVYSKAFANLVKTNNAIDRDKDAGYGYLGSNAYTIAIADIEAISKRTDLEVKIPALIDNSFVETLKLGLDKNGNSNIGLRLYGTVEKANISATFTVTGLGENDHTVSDEDIGTPSEEETSFTIPPLIEYEKKSTAVLNPVSAKASITLDNVNNVADIGQPKITVDEKTGKEYYILNVRLITDLEIKKLGLLGAFLDIDNASETYNVTDGEYEHFSAEQVEITIYGNTIGISIKDSTIAYGNGSNPYTINRGELVPKSSSFMADKIIAEYSEGKETATLRCDISEYYLYDSTKPKNQGDKVISAVDSGLNMTFTEGDIVIPMIPSAMGGDEPMSRYKDGSPKEFRVVGTSIINDGAVWQKIYLQEL
jgi:hypothetical protein